MISPMSGNTLNTNGMNTTDFTIETNGSMVKMLTGKVYTDTILAPMRELSTNAVDACKMANKEINYDVHLPTLEEPYFSVRDYGTGLEKHDLTNLFCTIGASTKRNSNKTNGTFGIGRVSPLAYADAFTVESHINDKYYSYMIAHDETGGLKAVELADTNSTEENGLKVSFNVHLDDISKFEETGIKLYRHFKVKPNLNKQLDLKQNITLELMGKAG